MNPDIVAAAIAYIQQSMSGSLGVTPTNPAVWEKYSPGISLPYCVVTRGPDETYKYMSNDPALAGYYDSYTTDGILFVSFVATTDAQLQSLVRQCLAMLVDTKATLIPVDGPVLYLRPESSHDIPMTDVGPGSPTQFKRTMVVRYAQEFPI